MEATSEFRDRDEPGARKMPTLVLPRLPDIDEVAFPDALFPKENEDIICGPRGNGLEVVEPSHSAPSFPDEPLPHENTAAVAHVQYREIGTPGIEPAQRPSLEKREQIPMEDAVLSDGVDSDPGQRGSLE